MIRLGAHMSIAGGVDRALERGASIGCDTIQVFLKSNRQWRGKKLTAAETQRFHVQQQATKIAPVFAHACYLINLAAAAGLTRRRSIAAMIDEIQRATQLGVPFIVMHPGAHLGAGERLGLRRVARSLDEVFRATRNSPVKIALETTAGQGSNLGYRFEHLAEIMGSVAAPERVAVCIDTCHLLAAGYDIRTPQGYRETMRKFDRVVGSNHVVGVHLNDSKAPLGSRVDRHAHIGQGHIGLSGFRSVLGDGRWRGLPMVLETPKSDDLHEDVENLRVLRRLSRQKSLPRG
ncbi:MAG TPA: deoxyribonuclease IV [Verrucomicrobiae bacterium]|nr:deoxyribonuclease IV [Verrucomicrobiae bacterium]